MQIDIWQKKFIEKLMSTGPIKNLMKRWPDYTWTSSAPD
jgi:hypothetical protein